MRGNKVRLIGTSSWIEYLRDLNSDSGKRVEALLIHQEAGWCDMTAVELWNGANLRNWRKE